MGCDSGAFPTHSRVSVIVPFHRDLGQLRQCLAALQQARSVLPTGSGPVEVIVAADGAVDDPRLVAAEHGAVVRALPGPRGPAFARSRAAAGASGDLLVFVDADVVLHGDALRRLTQIFVDDPTVGAAFGAYDEQPADRGFFSQCRNLAHAFIHRRSSREAGTFWAGLGAVRRNVFEAVRGFDERFTHPSVEDIDLGYRIRLAGFRIVLDPAVQGTHLKRWTLWSSIVSDIRDRGVPWTQLLNRYHAPRNDLNVTLRYRWAVVLSYGLLACLVGMMWRPALALPGVLIVATLVWLDRPYYQFFASRRGFWFTLAWFPFHVLHHLCNGVSFVVGSILYFGRRWFGISLPWALPVTPWSAKESE